MLATEAEAAPRALAAGDPLAIWPEPDWLREVADDPTYEWARVAWRTAAASPDAWFDAAKAEGVVARWPQLFKLTGDRFAGKPFRLNKWQAIIVRLLMGWKAPTEIVDDLGEPKIVHVRLYRRLMLWVPRKNGKSEFLAALALLFFAWEAIVEGEGYVFARDEPQARIVLRKMKAMVAQNEAWAAGVQLQARSIYLREFRANFEVLSGAEEGKHGKSPNVIVGDEMHEWRSREVSDTLRQGTGVRLQPIELYASTAGLKSNPTGFGLWEESEAILQGRIDDASTLVVIFAAEPDDDWEDEAAWRRANPSLGLSPTIAFLRREAKLAKDNPRAEAHFRRYHLNQWVDSAVRWLNMKRWDACAASRDGWKLYRETLRGRPCFLTFDVSSTRDVTALSGIFPPHGDDPKWRHWARYWIPEATLEERVANDRVPYDKWLAAGALETTPGDYVDQNAVLEAIVEALADYDVQQGGFDPWNARKLIADLQAEPHWVDPELFVEMRQGIQTLGEPTKQFERLVYAGQLDHGGHPVTRWMAGNTVVRFDDNMNFMPAKKKSAEKIDGIVAAVMGVGLALCGDADAGPSVYEQRGIVELEI